MKKKRKTKGKKEIEVCVCVLFIKKGGDFRPRLVYKRMYLHIHAQTRVHHFALSYPQRLVLRIYVYTYTHAHITHVNAHTRKHTHIHMRTLSPLCAFISVSSTHTHTLQSPNNHFFSLSPLSSPSFQCPSSTP